MRRTFLTFQRIPLHKFGNVGRHIVSASHVLASSLALLMASSSLTSSPPGANLGASVRAFDDEADPAFLPEPDQGLQSL